MKYWCSLLGSAVLFFSCHREASIPATDERVIRSVRTNSNQAIAAHDTVALIRAWTSDYHMLTSRNAEVSGAAAAVHKFAAEFKIRPDVIYVRTPHRIDVFNAWHMASEQGRWTGQWTEGTSVIKIEGTYFAKWHQLNGQWLIRDEVFVPLRCEGGAYCEQSPL